MNSFGRPGGNQRELRVQYIEDQVAFAASRNHTRHLQDRSSLLLNPPISKCSGGRHIFSIPTLNGSDQNILYRYIIRDADLDYPLILRWLGQVRMDEHFQKSTRICLGCVDHAAADGVPSAAVKYRPGRIEDWVTRIRYAIRKHLERQPKEQPIQKVFHPPCA